MEKPPTEVTIKFRPLKAWRYKKDALEPTPYFEPSDSLSNSDYAEFYDNKRNAIHLSYPISLEVLTSLYQEFNSRQILEPIPGPCFFAYRQTYTLAGKQAQRQGIIGDFRADNYDKDFAPHEKTFPHFVKEKSDKIEACPWQTFPSSLIYSEPSNEIESVINSSLLTPLIQFRGPSDILHELAIIENSDVGSLINQSLQHQKAFIADGHHRLEAHREFILSNEEITSGHLVLLSNAVYNPPSILPFYQVVDLRGSNFSDSGLKKTFESVTEHPNEDRWIDSLLQDQESCGIFTSDKSYYQIKFTQQKEEKSVNYVTRVNKTVLGKVFETKSSETVSSERIKLTNILSSARKLIGGSSDKIIYVQPQVSFEKLNSLAQNGYFLPEKSTSFYPKPISGFLFSKIGKTGLMP